MSTIMSVEEIDRAMSERAIDALLAHGCRITVHGHPDFVQRSMDRDAILADMEGMGVVEITMDIEGNGTRAWMRLMYDENGYDLFQDYSCSLEDILEPISGDFDPDNAPEAIQEYMTSAATFTRKAQDLQQLCYLLNVFTMEARKRGFKDAWAEFGVNLRALKSWGPRPKPIGGSQILSWDRSNILFANDHGGLSLESRQASAVGALSEGI